MSGYTLVIGNKNYSSWSLRAWLAMKHVGVDFAEVVIPLDEPGTRAAIAGHSPAGKVPVLKYGPVTVWDTAAIFEYLAERHPQAGLWPDAADARAMARSVAAEMHSGFFALREHMPMNLRKSLPGRGRCDGVAADIARIGALWQDCRARFGTDGPFLFGRFCAADAAFAPVVTRFATYGVELDETGAAYRDSVLSLPALNDWYAAARAEPWTLEAEEVE